MPHTYIELFLPEDIRAFPFFDQPRLTSKIALESLNGFNKLSNQERITILNQLIKKTDFAEAQEVYASTSNYAVFDSYFHIRRIKSRHIDAALRSSLMAFRSAIIDAQQNGSQLPHEEWQLIMKALPLIIGKTLGQDSTEAAHNHEEVHAQ